MKLLGHNNKAFTLIELLVVVAITGILFVEGVVANNEYVETFMKLEQNYVGIMS